MTKIRFPNESDEYRKARDLLLDAENEHREKTEHLAQLRRKLPLGGELKEDYVFEELVDGEVRSTRFSELFAPGKDTLLVYSFMYAPDTDPACPMCTSFLDGLEGQVDHINQQISTAVVAKHPIEKILRYAESRNWKHLRLLSSIGNTYNVDYFGEVDGRQTSTANVFHRVDGRIHHFWSSELSYGPPIEGGNTRHLDSVWPLWGILDMTPRGRGIDWYPRLTYDASG